MAEQELRFVDPTREEIVLANGPPSVAGSGDLIVISFTQISPRIEGISAGVSQLSDAVVVCRVALPPAGVRELARIIAGHGMANAPAAGNA
jgi:hypothetical protein